MTRLVKNDIDEIVVKLKQYDKNLKEQIGYSLMEIAAHAVGTKKKIKNYRTAVIPVTSGLGVIDGFSETVCGILKYCGIDAYVTNTCDVTGVQEAYETGADMIFMADDTICSAFSTRERIFSDNGYATGIGFAAALELAIKDTKDQKVLILGAGPVGTAAAAYMEKKQINAELYDIEESKARDAVKGYQYVDACKKMPDKIKFCYLFDATPERRVITEKDVTEKTVISAPGMPLGVSDEAGKIATVIHNPLELGIITMYYDCVSQLEALAYGMMSEEKAENSHLRNVS